VRWERIYKESSVQLIEKFEFIICGVSIYKVEGYSNSLVSAHLSIQNRIVKDSLHCLIQIRPVENLWDWNLSFFIDEILYSLFYVFRTFEGLPLYDFSHPSLHTLRCKIRDEDCKTKSTLPREYISHYRIAEGTTACLTAYRSLWEPHTFQVLFFSWTHSERLWQYSSIFQSIAYL
jgi:hypothetical protein